jgi:hypothetical protein
VFATEGGSPGGNKRPPRETPNSPRETKNPAKSDLEKGFSALGLETGLEKGFSSPLS